MHPRTINLKARLSEARKQVAPAISATELGRRLMQSGLPGFKPAQVSSLELGYRYATWPEVEALANILNVDPYWLANQPRPALIVPRAPKVIEPAEAKAAPKHKSARPAFVVRPAVAVPVAAPKQPSPPLPSAPPDLAPAEIPVLVPGAETEFRRQIIAELERTLLKLHDEKLKAFEWRSWREHEKKIRAAALGLVTLPE